MEKPKDSQELTLDKPNIKEIILLENRVSELLFTVGSRLISQIKSIQIMRDDYFFHRRDRKINDMHVFLELYDGQYFHLKVYNRHMLDLSDIPTDKVLLTGYINPRISHVGGTHKLRQGWYPADAYTIVDEIISQNPELFPKIKWHRFSKTKIT